MIQPSRAGKASSLDLSERTKFRITGTDRFRFLNGQITNDLRKVSETVAMEACVLNAKGKIDAHIFVGVLGESFLLDAEPDVREKLRARLERYIIADDVEIQDVTDQFSLFHVLSPEPSTAKDSRLVSVRRFAEQGCDIWSDRARHDASLQSELTEEIIPIEANLEQRTIDYQKGCYIGQEVISRIKMSGQTNKRLCGLIPLDNVPLQPTMKLAAPSIEGKEVGWITSATHSERMGKEIALGYVKRGFNSVGTKLDALVAADFAAQKPNTISVEVVPLPFV